MRSAVDRPTAAGEEQAPAPVTVPLSLMQQEIWDWLERWPRSEQLFNDTIRLTLPGPFDPDLVRRVLDHLVERHEPLRTTFHQDPGGLTYQSIAPAVDYELAVVDLTPLPPAERHAELLRLVAAQNARPIDIGAGPLFRAGLFRTGEDEAELAVTLEHIISDQTTDSILYSELRQVHGALAAGRAPALPPLPIQFADYAIWQRQWLTHDRLRQGLDYWRRQLRGMPLDTELPCDRPRQVDGDKRTACVDFLVPADVQEALEALTRRTRSTLFMTAVAAVQALVARWTGRPDVVVLTTFHGRDRPELEGLMGLFAGVAILRSEVDGRQSFAQAVERARQAVLGMLEHQYVPFDKVVEALVADLVADGVDQLPSVPVSVEFFHAAGDRLLSGMSLIARRPEAEGHLPADSPDVHDILNPLAFRIFGGDQLWGRLSYHEAVFDRATAERIVGELKALLAAAVRRPDAPLAELWPAVAPAEGGRP